MKVYRECLTYKLSSATVIGGHKCASSASLKFTHTHFWGYLHAKNRLYLPSIKHPHLRSGVVYLEFSLFFFSGLLLISQMVSVSLWGTEPSLLGSVSVLSLFRGRPECSSSSCLTVISMTCALGLLVSRLEWGGVFALEISGHMAETFF